MSRTPPAPTEALDPSRLRIPFMGKRARRTLPEEELQLTKSLDLSNSLSNNFSNNPNLLNNLSKLSNLNERLNLPKSLEVLVESFQETQDPPAKSHTTLDAWVFVLTYAIFGIALALCNLFNVSGRLCCVGLSPLPMLCLLLHAASSASLPISLALLLCALSLPTVCALWALPVAAAYITAAACSLLAFNHGPFQVACCVGAKLSMLLTVVADPRWGVSLAVFFLLLACMLSSEKVNVKVN